MLQPEPPLVDLEEKDTSRTPQDTSNRGHNDEDTLAQRHHKGMLQDSYAVAIESKVSQYDTDALSVDVYHAFSCR